MISQFIPGIIDDRTDVPKVQSRAVAFLDILGFKAVSGMLLSQPQQLDALDYQMRFAERVLVGDVGIAKDTDVRLFSDSICISSPVSPDHLVRMLFTLEALQLRLVNAGVFIRGGLAIGDHFQTSRTIVSAGLIAAYEMESKVAVYPRIAVHESFLAEISKLDEQGWSNPWRHQTHAMMLMFTDRVHHHSGLHIPLDRADRVRYVHYMAYLYSVDSGSLMRDYLSEHKNSIIRWMKQGRALSSEARVAAKHEWLVEYHNASADEVWGRKCPYRIDRDDWP